MDSSGFLVSYDTSIFTLYLKLSCASCVNALIKLVALKRICVNFNSPTLNIYIQRVLSSHLFANEFNMATWSSGMKLSGEWEWCENGRRDAALFHVRIITTACISSVLGFPVSLFEWWTQTTAACWCGELFPLTQEKNGRANWPSAVDFTVRSSANFWARQRRREAKQQSAFITATHAEWLISEKLGAHLC